jgi:formylglycine-generating enzyme required for sulfatase activity
MHTVDRRLNTREPTWPRIDVHLPGAEDLPPSLALLAYRHAIDVDHGRDFHHHDDQLIKSVEGVLQLSGPSFAGSHSQLPARSTALLLKTPRKRRKVRGIWVYFSILPLLAILGIVVHFITDRGSAAITSTNETEPHTRGGVGDSRSDRATTRAQTAPTPQPKLEWTNSIGMKFVGIEPGDFMMGSPSNDLDDKADEKPQHPARITRRFYLGTFEVTQGQYQKVMRENPSKHQGSELPVYHLNWLDAVQFRNRLSELEGRNARYRIDGDAVTIAEDNGYRLPTEVSQSLVEDPSGPTNSPYRVYRGGNWWFARAPRPHRSANRGWNGPQVLYGGVGIRLALNDPPQAGN